MASVSEAERAAVFQDVDAACRAAVRAAVATVRGPDGPTAEGDAAVRITPTRVEHSTMFGSADKRVWTA